MCCVSHQGASFAVSSLKSVPASGTHATPYACHRMHLLLVQGSHAQQAHADAVAAAAAAAVAGHPRLHHHAHGEAGDINMTQGGGATPIISISNAPVYHGDAAYHVDAALAELQQACAVMTLRIDHDTPTGGLRRREGALAADIGVLITLNPVSPNPNLGH